MDERMARSSGMTGRTRSRCSAARIGSTVESFVVAGAAATPLPSALPLPPGIGEARGCGVPSGAGELATESRGVLSASLFRCVCRLSKLND